MHEIQRTDVYDAWFAKLRDPNAKSRINTRLMRLGRGLVGDAKFVGGGVSEIRIDYGPGYRVYFMRRDKMVIVLLAGGDKRTQAKDIETAMELVASIRSAK